MKVRSAAALSAALIAAPARADDPPAEQEVPTSIDLNRDTAVTAPESPPPEAPPPRPYQKSVVLDTTLGAMAFLGEFGRVAPPGPWLHTQLGYELTKWFMLYGEADLAFTDTSNRQAPPNVRAFPLFGFGAGARFTLRFSERIGVYAQGGLGAMKADVATNALGILGFRDAESLALYLGTRLGLEWYQVDRHMALGLAAGIRTPQGFARAGLTNETALAIDAGLSIRYAF
jgi:hypothetical protein